MGTNSDMSEGYGLEASLLVGVAYEARKESGAQFEKAGNEREILCSVSGNQKMTVGRHLSCYASDDKKILNSVGAELQGCSAVQYIGNSKPLGAVDVGVNDKTAVARAGNFDSVVCGFLPETPRVKEQQYIDVPSERSSQFNIMMQAKNDPFLEKNSGYSHVLSHDSQFAEMGFQRAHFIKAREAKNLIYQESSGHPESGCPRTDMGVSGRGGIELAFDDSLKETEEMNGTSVPVDSHGLSERLESARAAAVLTSLQEQEMMMMMMPRESVPRKTANLAESEDVELTADLAESDSGQENEESNDPSKCGDMARLNLQIRRTEQGEQTYPGFVQAGDNPQPFEVHIKSHKNKEFALSAETSGKNSSGEGFCEGKSVNNNNNDKDNDQAIKGETRKINEDGRDVDKKAEEFSHGLSATSKKNSLEDDVVSVQLVESPPSPPVGRRRRFRCKLCNKSWKLRKELSKHMKTHTATRKFACSLCNSSFVNRTLLKKHLLMHTDVRSFTCLECPASFTSEVDLKYHQRVHTGAQSFSCTECSYTAKRQKDLTKHMLVHSAAKVYTCQFCKFSSKRKYSLQRHLKTAHSSAKIYECTLCSFQTSAVDSFKVHVAMHVSTNTTACIICNTVIKKRPSLIEHLLGHSSDQEAKCKECDETFATIQEYMLHLLSHKDASSRDQAGVGQGSGLDLATSSLQNGSMDPAAGIFGFLARKGKVIMDTPTMEAKLSQMSTIASRLADMTKVVTLLNEKSRVVFQLAEVSTLATELAVISGNVLQSYKSTYGVASGSTSSKTTLVSAPHDATEDSSFVDDEDDDDGDNESEMASDSNMLAANIKEELQDNLYPAAEAGMQIQVDFNGEPVSCVQKDDPLVPGTTSKSKGDKHLKCSRCNLTFTDTRSLKRHRMAHDDVRPYSCEKCGQSFRRNEHLKKHMVTHSDERPFTCKECSYAAKTEHRLKIHMLCHSQTKAFACQHCTYTARTNYELNHHMKRHEPRSCSQCSFICYSRAEMKKHVFTHSSFGCSECEFTTHDRAEYTKHAKKHSLVQHLCCELCGYSCDTMKKFKYHKLRHENKTPYQCPDCDYKCSSRASFDCHRLKHAGLKPYLCSFCGAAFRKTSHLNQHLLIHKDEKAFKCGECGYACRTKHNLKEHEMTHSGEKPFACKYCNFSCRRNKALQLHMLKHENHAMMIPQLQLPAMQLQHLQMPLQMSMLSSGP